MTVFNARALASLVTVADNALSKRLTTILTALVKVVEDEDDEELLSAVDEALRALFESINDPRGFEYYHAFTVRMVCVIVCLLVVHANIDHVHRAKHDSPKRRVSACDFFASFCEESGLDSSLYRVDWIRQLVSALDDSQVLVHTAAWHALDKFVKSIPKDELEVLSLYPFVARSKVPVPLVIMYLASVFRRAYHQQFQSLLLVSRQVATNNGSKLLMLSVIWSKGQRRLPSNHLWSHSLGLLFV
jgi:hypothetical protein